MEKGWFLWTHFGEAFEKDIFGEGRLDILIEQMDTFLIIVIIITVIWEIIMRI